jgi:hypothetical protein
VRTVELSVLLTNGAKTAAILFCISLVSWLYADIPLVNPYVSVLGLVACPFFYAMGRMVKKTA